MKNLKRALSLVLSAAMMVGMMAIGTSAFADVDSNDNLEAISVMNMVGIMEGTGDDTFEPDRVVTRNEMAVIICNLMDLKLNGYHPFTDVPEWADKYVGALYVNGLTSGTSATTYGGSATVTTTDAALMIMKTLGYFEYQGEFEDDYALATVKRGTLINLFDKIDAGVKDGLTRGEVAQMVLNALTKEVVIMKETGGMKVEGNGITVSAKASYEPLGTGKDLKTKLYDGKLQLDETTSYDAFKRPAVKWTYTGNGEIESVTAAKAPSIVLTAETSVDDMTKLLKEYKAHDRNINYSIDGKRQGAVTKEYVIDNAKADATNGITGITGNGVKVEIFIDKYNKVTDIVAINEHYGEVYSVTKANEKTGAERFVTVKGTDMTFETENFAKKDKVVYTKAYDKTINENGTSTDVYTIKSMKAAEMVEGIVTGIVAGKSIVLDGVSYKLNKAYAGSVKLGDKVEIYVDSYGNLLKNGDIIAAAASVEDYVVVTAKGNDAFTARQLKVLKADGTTEVVAFEQYVDAEATKLEDNSSLADASVEIGKIYTMEDADSDGKYEFYAPKTAKENDKYAGFDAYTMNGALNAKDDNLGVTLVNGVTGSAATWSIADDAVVFVEKCDLVDSVDANNNPIKVLASKTNREFTVMTGAKLAAADNADIVMAYATKASTGFYSANLLYVKTTTSSSSDLAYGYVTADPMSVKNSDNETVAQITFWNGTETVVALTDKANANKLVKGEYFSYKLNADGEVTNIDDAVVTAGAVTAFNGEKIIINGVTYDVDEDTVIIYVDAKNKAGAETFEISLADKTDDETAYVNNVKFAYDVNDTNANKDITILFVDVLNKI